MFHLTGAKYDYEQRYQSITGQCEELIQTNNQLQRSLKDTELRIQQLEANKTQVNTRDFSHSTNHVRYLVGKEIR